MSNGVYTAGIKTEDSDFYILTFEEQEHVAKNYINMFATCNRPFAKFIINKEVVLDDLIDIHVKAYDNITKSINDIDYIMTELKDMYEKTTNEEEKIVLENRYAFQHNLLQVKIQL